MKVTIRPLKDGDEKVSYKWRNDPEIWLMTGSRPNIEVTEQVEYEWLQKVLTQKDSLRYAICVGDKNEYVGNVQITNITEESGEFHIFIGNKYYWGKGVGATATRLMIDEGFKKGLKQIYLYVRLDNVAAIKVYEKCGMSVISQDGEQLKMIAENDKESKQ